MRARRVVAAAIASSMLLLTGVGFIVDGGSWYRPQIVAESVS
jgi:hypothetical protein